MGRRESAQAERALKGAKVRKFIWLLTGGLAFLLLILAGRTLLLAPSPPVTANSGATPPATTAEFDNAARRLAGAIRFQTISWGGGRKLDADAFDGLIAYLAEAYPAVHSTMTREIIGGHSLLFVWKSADADRPPIGFIGHLDVVPVEAGTQSDWSHPPFSGDIADGAVWGRGALDNKGPFIALLEAAEALAASGFTPSRDIYFMFGQDEELGGDDGAGAIAATLKARGVHFAWTLDEGPGVVKDMVPGVDAPVALIATAEKGSTTLRFTASAPGGHSSAPGKDTAVSLVSRAVVAVTEHPYPIEFDKNTVAFLHALAPEMAFPARVALANLWLTGPIIKATLAKSPAAAASMRTTTAATIIEGGTKSNVLPQHASAVVNYRIHPRDTMESVKARAEKLIDDKRVTVEALGGRNASAVSSTATDGYATIAASTRAVFGAIPVAPSLMIGGTDSRHYPDLADDNYRFMPFVLTPDDLHRFHGTDERVKIDDLKRAASWYFDFIARAAGSA